MLVILRFVFQDCAYACCKGKGAKIQIPGEYLQVLRAVVVRAPSAPEPLPAWMLGCHQLYCSSGAVDAHLFILQLHSPIVPSHVLGP